VFDATIVNIPHMDWKHLLKYLLSVGFVAVTALLCINLASTKFSDFGFSAKFGTH